MSLDKPSVPRRVARRIRGQWIQRPGLVLSASAIVGGIVVSELLLFTGRTWPAIWGHLATLLVCLLLLHRDVDATLVQPLALIPLFRLVNLGMPVFFQLTAYWFPLIYGPLIPALVYVDHLDPDLDVPFGWKRGLLGVPLTIPIGGLLAEVEAAIIQSEALIPTWSLGQLLMITVVMVCFVGFVEEYLFRGLLQAALQDHFGRWTGILVASGLFGMMHSGYGLPEEIVFAGVIGLVFGILYDYLDSLVFVSILHGVLNVFLFAVLPIQGSFLSL